jgi:hypothetical protein
MPPKKLKTAPTDVACDTAQKEGLVLIRLPGIQLLQRLQKAIESGAPLEKDLWLWGEKENAVSLWVKLSASLLKVMEYEMLLGAAAKPAMAQQPLSNDDMQIIERFVALHHGAPSGTHLE